MNVFINNNKRMTEKNQKVALITGAAKRIGACIATACHKAGYRVIIHYRHSRDNAEALVKTLNQQREQSAACIAADLDQFDQYEILIQNSYAIWNQLDLLVNNASTFSQTPVGKTTENDWDLLLNSNLKAPYFLSQCAASLLRQHHGNIINIIDIYGANAKPMKNYSVYSCAKAGLSMLTKSLALELAPHVRVNAVAPGHVIWPENQDAFSDQEKKIILSNTSLQKEVSPDDIAQTVLFLAQQSAITGQIISVDGGRF